MVAWIGLPHVIDRCVHQLLEDFLVHIRQLVDIQAGLSSLVLPQPAEDFVIRIETSHDVQGQGLDPGGEPDQEPFRFATRGVFVMIASISDDVLAPHLGFFSADLFH